MLSNLIILLFHVIWGLITSNPSSIRAFSSWKSFIRYFLPIFLSSFAARITFAAIWAHIVGSFEPIFAYNTILPMISSDSCSILRELLRLGAISHLPFAVKPIYSIYRWSFLVRKTYFGYYLALFLLWSTTLQLTVVKAIISIFYRFSFEFNLCAHR